MSDEKLVDVDTTEQGVYNWPDPEIKGWRNYRIEYGGCNRDCYCEGDIWLPSHVDSDLIGYKLFEILQIPEAYDRFKKAIVQIHKEHVGKKSNWKSSDENLDG